MRVTGPILAGRRKIRMRIGIVEVYFPGDTGLRNIDTLQELQNMKLSRADHFAPQDTGNC